MLEFFASADALLKDSWLAAFAVGVGIYFIFTGALSLFAWLGSPRRRRLSNWKEPERHEP